MRGLASVAAAAEAAAVSGVVDVLAGCFEFSAGAGPVVGDDARTLLAEDAGGVSGEYCRPEGPVCWCACVAAFGGCSACAFCCARAGRASSALRELSAAWCWTWT